MKSKAWFEKKEEDASLGNKGTYVQLLFVATVCLSSSTPRQKRNNWKIVT